MASKVELPLSGLRVAFVGKLGGLSRREAMRLVREAGAIPCDDASRDGVDLLVLGAEESPLAEDGLLDNAQRWAEQEGQLEVITETELWQRLGLVEPELAARRLYTPAMLADLLGVSVRVIRRWHRRGLIIPVRTVHQLPYFDFQEVATARRLAELLASGASPAAIERKLARLARVLPDVERPLAQLSVIVEGRARTSSHSPSMQVPIGPRRYSSPLRSMISSDRATFAFPTPRHELPSSGGVSIFWGWVALYDGRGPKESFPFFSRAASYLPPP